MRVNVGVLEEGTVYQFVPDKFEEIEIIHQIGQALKRESRFRMLVQDMTEEIPELRLIKGD